MKKLIVLFVLGFFLTAGSAIAQTRNFDGIQSGTLTKDNDEEFTITIYIEDNNVYSVTTDEDGDRVKDYSKEVSWSKGYGEQINYVWIDKGGAWTETQIFSIAWSKENKISVHFMRHVSNESSDFDGNTDWGYTAIGYLYKE